MFDCHERFEEHFGLEFCCNVHTNFNVSDMFYREKV